MLKSLLPGLPNSAYRVLILVVLVLGIAFRFINLDHKVFWKDEAYSLLRVSAYTKGELIQNEFDGELIQPSDLLKYQIPNADRGVQGTLKSLATDAPMHSPFYFVVTRFATQLTGNPILASRGLAAFFSLLIFPALYWLCLELFHTSFTGWIAIALVAVSPFQLAYAQEARQYSLWAAVTLFSSAALLRAMRTGKPRDWIVYTGAIAFGFYTYLFSILVAASHHVYVWLMDGLRIRRNLILTALAALISSLLFIPWILVVLNNLERFSSGSTSLSLMNFVRLWARFFSYLVFDLQLGYDDPFRYGIPVILLLFIFCAYSIIRHLPARASGFILILTLFPFLTVTIPGVLFGGLRAATPRYFIPTFLGVQLALAFTISHYLINGQGRAWVKRMWEIIFVSILSAGVFSCVVNLQSNTWWNKYASYYDADVAEVVNATERPLLLSSDSTNVGILSLAYLLDDHVTLQLFTEPALPEENMGDGYSDVFVFNVSNSYRRALETERNYQLETIIKSRPTRLWKLE